jgi:signal transduction histidine kinase
MALRTPAAVVFGDPPALIWNGAYASLFGAPDWNAAAAMSAREIEARRWQQVLPLVAAAIETSAPIWHDVEDAADSRCVLLRQSISLVSVVDDDGVSCGVFCGWQPRERKGFEAGGAAERRIATVAHELRTPLGALSNLVEIARIDPRRTNVTAMGRVVNHMRDLVTELFDQARDHRGGERREEVRAAEIVRDAVMFTREQLTTLGHSVSIAMDEPRCALLVDRSRVTRALANLIGNAARFTPADGRIEVFVAHRDGVIEIGVRDSGAGFEADQLEALRQWRGSAASEDGLGLGLSLVREIALAHGGELCVASDGQDRGATVSLRLPTAPTGAAPPPSRERP